MSEVIASTFACPACGKRYKWKPELAGRKVKCACGRLIAASQGGSVAATPVLGYQQKTDAKAGSGTDAYFPDRIKDFQIPLVLLCVGGVVEFVAAWIAAGRAGNALAYTGATVVLGTGVLLLAMFGAAKARGIELGRFWTAVLKLSAISIAPSAAMTLLNIFLRFIPFGGILVWVAVFCFYFALIGMLFDLDQEETWYCVMVVFITKVAIFVGLIFLRRMF